MATRERNSLRRKALKEIRKRGAMQLHVHEDHPGVAVGYALPTAELAPFVSTISHIEIAPGAGSIHDLIVPEWGNVRFAVGGRMALRTGPGPLEDCSPAGGIGPTSRATRFSLTAGRYWSISLTPLGWARFVGVPARTLAETWLPVAPGSPFAHFAPLSPVCDDPDRGRVLAAIHAHLGSLAPGDESDVRTIRKAHEALVDSELRTVGDLAERTGLSLRTFERFSARVFGFTPKLLIRRQRFLRSLAHYMLDPSLDWVDTLDTHYHDQAHFIRDFKRFMDLMPSEYAKLPHPVMQAAAQARMATAGSAVQVLQAP